MVASSASVVLAAAVVLGNLPAATAKYQIDTRENILSSARTLAYDLGGLYQGNQSGHTPGLISEPPPEGDYYWWQSGAFMGTYIDYWRWTGDDSYNQLVSDGLLAQAGEDSDFAPLAQRATLGNDDQCTWALAALLAAESGFPSPPQGKPQWLALAQAVFEQQNARVDRATCNGGLRWQISPVNSGYNYKNSFSNGCFFNLGARLARFTGNDTYAKIAEQTWDWLYAANLIDHDTFAVYDGAHTQTNCTDINKAQFSYSVAILTEGAAFMYNFTNGSSTWKDRTTKLTDAALSTFFPNNTAFEVACEGKPGTCSTDMLAFKGYLHRWLSSATQLAPFVAEAVLPVLRRSAQAAVDQCTGGASGRRCGFYWARGGFVEPATTGAGEQMNVLAAVSGLLVGQAKAPGTAAGGPTSSGGGGGGAASSSGAGIAASSTPASAAVSSARVAVGPVLLLALCMLSI